MSEFPAAEPRKLLASRIVAMGAIPIAVFCAAFVLMRALVGPETIRAQAWTISVSLALSVASLFLLGRLVANAIVDEIEAMRSGVRTIMEGAEAPEVATLTPPLEELKHELLGFARDVARFEAECREAMGKRFGEVE